MFVYLLSVAVVKFAQQFKFRNSSVGVSLPADAAAACCVLRFLLPLAQTEGSSFARCFKRGTLFLSVWSHPPTRSHGSPA